jgi:hypothetical protein
MSETKMWTGGCHCGRVRFEVETDLDRLMTCNCSLCQKRGSIMNFVPRSAFHLLSGGDGQTEYQFNRKVIHHLFCPTCGVASYSIGNKPDGTPMVAVNIRCLDDIDVASLKTNQFDGKSL